MTDISSIEITSTRNSPEKIKESLSLTTQRIKSKVAEMKIQNLLKINKELEKMTVARTKFHDNSLIQKRNEIEKGVDENILYSSSSKSVNYIKLFHDDIVIEERFKNDLDNIIAFMNEDEKEQNNMNNMKNIDKRLPVSSSFKNKFCPSSDNVDSKKNSLSNNYVNSLLSKFIVRNKEAYGNERSKRNNNHNNFDNSRKRMDSLDGTMNIIDESITSLESSRLVESLFVVGPDNKFISDFARTHMNDSNSQTNENANSRQVEPKMLFSVGSDPDVESEVLPFFCFPNGVEVVIGDMDRKRNSFKRKNSFNSLNNIQSKPISNKKSPHCFIFILTNHTSYKFVVCMVLPRSFKIYENDSEGCNSCLVNTNYCLCAVTQLPFISYVSHILFQSDRMGWVLSGLILPIAAYDPKNDNGNSPTYNILNELAARLRRIQIPTARFTPDGIPFPVPPIELLLPWRSSVDGTIQTQKRLSIVMRRDLQQSYYSYQSISADKLHQRQMNGFKSYEESIIINASVDREATFHVLLWSLPILLKHFSLEKIVLILGCVITEMKLVVHSPDLKIVSGCLLSLIHLLRPLKWVGPVIVTLPPSLDTDTFLESPVPIILGMQALPAGYKVEEGIVVVEPEQRSVILHATDVVASHTLTLPQHSSLIEALKSPADIILKLTNNSPRISKTNINFSPRDEKKNGINILPLPIELDTESPRGQQFLDAVSNFSNIVEAHIQATLNTSVKLAWETRNAERKKKSHLLPVVHNISVNKDKVPIDRRHTLSSLPFQKNINEDVINVMREDSQSSLSTADTTVNSTDLPPLETILNAPRLLTRGQGGGSLLFIQRLQGTQMFNSYCQAATQEYIRVTNIKKKKCMKGENENEINIELSHDKKVNDQPQSFKPRGPSPSLLRKTGLKMEVIPETFDKEDEDDDGEENDLREKIINVNVSKYAHDPLVSLFSIIITGTIPLESEKITELIESYKDTSDLNNLTLENSFKVPFTDKLLKESIWCNGRCHGLADTPLCTTMCLHLWEERVNYIRHQNQIKFIAQKYRNSELVLHDKRLKSYVDRVPVTKHEKETMSQYQQRVSFSEKDSKKNHVNVANSPKKSSVKVITNFYAKRDYQRKLTHRYKKSLDIIKRFLSLYIFTWRFKKRWYSSIIIQQFVRGFLIRCKTKELVNYLVNRKIERFSAKIKLRNWIRKDFSNVHKAIMGSINSKLTDEYYITDDFLEVVSNRHKYVDGENINLTPVNNDDNLIKNSLTKSNLQTVNNSYSNNNYDHFDEDNISVCSDVSSISQQSTTNFSQFKHLIKSKKYKIKEGNQYQKNVHLGEKALNILGKFFQKTIKVDINQNIKKVDSHHNQIDKLSPDTNFAVKSLFDIDKNNISNHDVVEKNKLSSKTNNCLDLLDNKIEIMHKNLINSCNVDNVYSSIDAEKEYLDKLENEHKVHHAENPNSPHRKLSNTFSPNPSAKSGISPFHIILNKEITPNLGSKKNNEICNDNDYHTPINMNEKSPLLIVTPKDFLSADYNIQQVSPSNISPIILPIRNYTPKQNSVLGTDFPPSALKATILRETSQVVSECEDNQSKSTSSLDDGVSTKEDTRALKSLGPLVNDLLSLPQRRIILDMWSILRVGIEVMKHGRQGRPKKKVLYCDIAMTKLYWRNKDDGPGEEILPVDNKKSRRNSIFNNSKFFTDDSHREILFSQILEVRDDISTDVMRRSLTQQFVVNQLSCLISIILFDRSLDFEVDEQKWGPFYHALQVIVNYYQVILPSTQEEV